MKGRGWGSCEGKGVGIMWREGGGEHVEGRGWGTRGGKGVGIMWREGGGDHVVEGMREMGNRDGDDVEGRGWGRGWGSCEGKGVGIM